MRRLLSALVFWIAGSASAYAACSVTSLTFKDAAGTTQTLCFGGSAGQFLPQYQIVDSTGANILSVNASGQIALSNLFALDTSVNGILRAQGSTTSGQSGPLAQGAVTTGPPTYTTAQTDPLSLDTSGLLRVSIKDTPANTNPFIVAGAGTAGTPGTAVLTVQGIASGTPIVDNLTQIAGQSVVTAGVNGTLAIGGNQAAGNNISSNTNPQLIGGSDYGGTPKLQTLKIDSTGLAYVNCTTCLQSTMGTATSPLYVVDTTLSPLVQNMNLNVNLATVGQKLFYLGPHPQASSIPTVDATDQPARLVQQPIAAQLNATVVEPVLDAIVTGGKLSTTTNLTQIASNVVTTALVNGTLAVGGNQLAGGNISTNVGPVLIGGSDYSGTPHIQNWKVDTGGSGYVNCSNCSGTGVSQTDQGTWIAGTSQFASSGGVFQLTPTSNPLANSTFGTFQSTAYRALFVNLRDGQSKELGTSASPLTVADSQDGARIAAALAAGPQIAAKSVSVALAWNSPSLPAALRDSGNADATDPGAHSIVVSPYAPRSAYWAGAASSSDGSAHTLQAGIAGNKIFVTGIQCFRTDVGTAMDYLTLNDTASTTVALPSSGGSNPPLMTPLQVAMGSNLTFTVSAPITSVFCNAQGFFAKN